MKSDHRSFDNVLRLAALVVLPAVLAGCFHDTRGPDTPFGDEVFAIGQRYYLKQDYTAAASRFQEYLKFDLRSAEEARGRYWLGRCLMMQRRCEEALGQFDGAIACRPDADDLGLVMLARADALRQLGRLDEAITAYQRLTDRSGVNVPADLAMFGLAQCYRSKGRTAEAGRVLAELRQRFPDSPVLDGSTAHPPDTATFHSVQVGAYETQKIALEMVARLRGQSFNARIDQVDGRYHVRVGRFSSRDEALAQEARLKRSGYSTFVVQAN